MTTTDEPTVPPVPSSPFARWQLSVPDPAYGFPLVTLVRVALDGAVDGRATDYAGGLFLECDERGLDAWREMAVMLAQFLLSSGRHGTGPAAASRYLNAAPVPSIDTPARNLATLVVATFIAQGRQMTERVLAGRHHTGAEITGAAKLLFCTAAVDAGYPAGEVDRLRDELCQGVR